MEKIGVSHQSVIFTPIVLQQALTYLAVTIMGKPIKNLSTEFRFRRNQFCLRNSSNWIQNSLINETFQTHGHHLPLCHRTPKCSSVSFLPRFQQS